MTQDAEGRAIQMAEDEVRSIASYWEKYSLEEQARRFLAAASYYRHIADELERLAQARKEEG